MEYHGLRLDLSFVGYFTLLSLLVYWIARLVRFRADEVVRWFQRILFVAVAIILIADPFFYRYWGQKANLSFLQFLGEENAGFQSIHWSHYFIALVLIGLFALLYRIWNRKWIPPQQFHWPSYLIIIVIAFGLLRGGWSIVPVNISSAFYSSNDLHNYTSLNAVWNVMATEFERDNNHRIRFFDSEEDAEQIWIEQPEVIDTLKVAERNANYNVVLIVLESFSAKVCDRIGGRSYGCSKNMDRAMDEGVVFSSAYASSFRSDKGLLSLVTGMPSTARQTLTHYATEISRLPNLFDAVGEDHHTSFYYGGDPEFANLKVLFRQADERITEGDYDSKVKGPWGIHDEAVFDRFYADFEQREGPQFTMLFSLSSHEPFRVPMERKNKDPYLNSIAYTDSCFGVLYDKLRSSDKWENTLVVITADHGTVRPEFSSSSARQNFHIPIILTGGVIDADSVVNTVVSQAGIGATILDILGRENVYPFQTSLLRPAGIAYYSYFDGVTQVREGGVNRFDFGQKRYLVNDLPPLEKAYYHLANSYFFTP